MQKFLEVGQIVNTFGIKGEVKVKPFTDEIERFEELKTVYLCEKDEMKKIEIEQVKYHKDMVLLKLKGIDTVNDAEKQRGKFLKIDRKDAKKLPEGVYFIVDLLGLPVYTEEGRLLGKVEDIFNSGASDIYVVKNEEGKQILLPGIPEVLKKVDLAEEKIIVHLLKGLEEEGK